jgi:hypothetical protein
MRHLKVHPIYENKMEEDIEILNNLSDIFSGLEDNWGFEIDYNFITYEEKQYDSKKYTGTIYNLSGQELHKFPSHSAFSEREWFISGKSLNVKSDLVPKIYQEMIGMVKMAESIINIKNSEKLMQIQKNRGDIYQEFRGENWEWVEKMTNPEFLNRVDVKIVFRNK